MRQIRIKVFLNQHAEANASPCFERLLDFSPDLLFPYDKTVEVMHSLFGQSAVISFTII